MRLRITFSKIGAAKYSGHLDLHRTWERTLRRAGVALAYSQGFNPQPRIQLAAALPLGITSEGEIMDIWIEGEADLVAMRRELDRAVPPGIELTSLQPADAHLAALQTQVRAAEYTAAVESDVTGEELDSRIATLLAAESLPRVRRGKAYDLRPLVESLARESSDGLAHTLRMRLTAREAATGRPEEVLAALGLGDSVAQIHRIRLLFADAFSPASHL
ncbi:MAG: DUF2344 domain-containing protein [Chloroflexi bacterium]|nr:DUF2344 domain-containing protein [Chloroflexota bacterium]